MLVTIVLCQRVKFLTITPLNLVILQDGNFGNFE